MTWMVDCYICGRNVEEALTVRVQFGHVAAPVEVCDECVSRGDERSPWPADEDEDEEEGAA